MKVISEEYIRLTEEYSQKLDVVASAILEEKTKKQLVEGGINIMLANALHNLYKDNEITEQGLESGLKSLPDYLAEKVRADLQADWQYLNTSSGDIHSHCYHIVVVLVRYGQRRWFFSEFQTKGTE